MELNWLKGNGLFLKCAALPCVIIFTLITVANTKSKHV